jgi:hypothetical protein
VRNISVTFCAGAFAARNTARQLMWHTCSSLHVHIIQRKATDVRALHIRRWHVQLIPTVVWRRCGHEQVVAHMWWNIFDETGDLCKLLGTVLQCGVNYDNEPVQ